jgi:hypothetical protein
MGYVREFVLNVFLMIGLEHLHTKCTKHERYLMGIDGHFMY